jgi:nitroimidazol reductase NimA-like FMN-containing flavoprotein (pyridoxamine 5'-phosphate oxidase superfamily)
MVVKDMTAEECRAMLSGMHVARLACARNNQPYIVPIHVDFDHGWLYGYATVGMKIEWMRQNPLVCLETDTVTGDGHWTTVVVFGRYEELPDTPANAGPRAVAERLFQKHPMWWEPASVPAEGHERRTPVVYRIRVDRVTGRRAVPAWHPSQPAAASRPDVRWTGWLAHVLRRRR